MYYVRVWGFSKYLLFLTPAYPRWYYVRVLGFSKYLLFLTPAYPRWYYVRVLGFSKYLLFLTPAYPRWYMAASRDHRPRDSSSDIPRISRQFWMRSHTYAALSIRWSCVCVCVCVYMCESVLVR